MGIEKTKLLACNSIYWIGMNVDIKNHINTMYIWLFSKTEQIILAEDKLSPDTNPGFLKSEENVKLHTFIYT